MALPVNIINLDDKLKVFRTRFNDLLETFEDFTFDIGGDLDFNGQLSQTSETIIVNSNETQSGSISKLPGLEIERGTLTNYVLIFDETDDKWKSGLKGGSLTAFSLEGHNHDSDYLQIDGSTILTGDLQIGNNKIVNTSGNEGIEIDTSGNLTLPADLTLTSGDIDITSGSINLDNGNLTLNGDINTNNIVLEDGLNPTTINLYNEYVDSSNYERGFYKFESNVLKMGVDNLGTGTTPEIAFVQTGTVKIYVHNAEILDDGSFSLPAITTSAFGWIVIGDNEERSLFTIDSTGSVTSLNSSSNIVLNADTDLNICIGTAGTQEPLIIKNRLGGSKNIMLTMWYN